MADPRWIHWLGKPYCIDGDPAVDGGCSCVILMARVREDFFLTAPSEDDLETMIGLARTGKKQGVLGYIKPHLQRIADPEPGSFSFIFTEGQFCVYTCVGDGLLRVHVKRGVCWSNLARFSKKLFWYHWK